VFRFDARALNSLLQVSDRRERDLAAADETGMTGTTSFNDESNVKASIRMHYCIILRNGGSGANARLDGGDPNDTPACMARMSMAGVVWTISGNRHQDAGSITGTPCAKQARLKAS
jgi:hypothetical protein